MNLPNRLTIFRIFLVPLLVLVMIFPFAQFNIYFPYFEILGMTLSLKNLIALAIFILAVITDYLDGYIARKYRIITSFGQFFDPIADKILVNTVFIVLASRGLASLVPVLIMIWRDTLVDGIRMLASKHEVIISANALGKLKTVVQMLTIIVILVQNFPFERLGIPVDEILLWFATFISVFSGISYFRQVKEIVFKTK